MKTTRIRALMLSVLAVAVFAVLPGVYAHADSKSNPVNANKAASLVEITLGKGEVLTMPGNVADVLVANPAIADVSALQADKLYVVGSRLGDTNLMVLDAQGNVLKRVDIHVKIDEVAIQSYLKELYPDEDVKVKALNGRFFLTGNVSTPDVSNKIANVIATYFNEATGRGGNVDTLIVNLLQVAGEQQVMLQVKIMEVSKSLLRELGINTEVETTGDVLGGQTRLVGALAVNDDTGLTQIPFAVGGLALSNGFGPLRSILSALENDQLAQTLAEPNLTAISGEQAGFLAGGEFPVPSGRDQDGNLIIQYRSFGVSLNFRPVVLSSERISLQMDTEVSSISRENSVVLNGLTVPGLNIRRASTTVELGSGGSLMIAGLLQSKTLKGMAGLPGIQEAPILGDLISSDSFNRQETELLIIVTPILVKAFSANDNAKRLDQTGAVVNTNATTNVAGATPVASPAPIPATLRQAFVNNIKRIYGRKAPKQLDDAGSFGYMLE